MISKITRILILQAVFIPLTVLAGGGMPAAPVEVARAINVDISPYVWVTGTVMSRFNSQIAAEVEGNLKELADVGDRVDKGDVIARIDDKSYRLLVNEIRSEIKPIEMMMEFYGREAGRLKELAMKNNAAKNQMDETEAKRDEAQAKIAVIKAKLATAQDNLEKTVVRAPFNGVITERIKMPGERVEAGETIVRLIDTDSLEVQARVQQESVEYIKQNDTLLLTGSSEQVEGIVRTVIPVGDTVSRLYEVRIQFNQPTWTAGKAVKIAVPIREKQNVLAVPRDALVIRQSGVIVYKINENNISEIVPVQTGISNTTHIQITGNIRENDRVVVRGNERLRPGTEVNVTKEKSAE